MEIVNNLIDKKDVIILCASICFLVGAFLLINSIITNKKIRLLVSVITSFFISLQLISLFFTRSFVGYKFYAHMNLRGASSMSSLFITQIVGITLIFLVLVLMNYFSCNISQYILKRRNGFIVRSVLIVICTALFLKMSTFICDTKSLFSIFYVSNENFQEILHNNNIDGYVSPDQIKCKAGKNIIVLSLESIERGFLTKKYSALTPNLNKFKDSWNYYDITQNQGSDWTSGSLYTYLTGFPAFFGMHCNNIFQKAYHSEISSISHVLEKAHYNTIYLNGNTEFSGIIEMLQAFHFNKIIDTKNVKKNGFESNYGIRDKDLFELAKNEISNQQKLNQSFAIFLSTTDTHFPNGFYDERMEPFVSEKNTELEFMVAAVDYMIGDLISFLESKNLLENTAVFIFPDHLKMGSPSMFDGTGERGLYLITNSQIDSTVACLEDTLYQIDLPKMILNGADIDHNLKFFTDCIYGKKDDYIQENIIPITEINTNGLLRIDSKPFTAGKVSDNYMKYKKDTSRYIAHAGGRIAGYNYTNSKEALDSSYEKGFRLFELDILQTKDNEFVAVHDWKNWAEMTNYKGERPVLRNQFLEYKLYGKFTPLDMNGINKWFSEHKDAILITDKINDPVWFSNEFVDPNRLMMELFDMEAVNAGLSANILSAMPSESIINKVTIDDVKLLADKGVKNIAISRRFIKNNKDLLLEFKQYNIKPYAFHINFDRGFDEDYVTKYEMDYIYGIYADEWSFE